MIDPLQSDLPPAERERIRHSALYNDDLAPISSHDRRWGLVDIAHLWVGMSVCIPTYMLASSLIDGGMNWWQAVLTVALGNLIVLVPMVLNGHAGTKYGITFPVFARAAFGTAGTHVASVLRGIVACGWFGIQTWIGGFAIYKLLLLQWPGLADSPVIGFISSDLARVNVAQFACFLFFWWINVAIFWRGMESIRKVENWGAPLLIALGLALLVWAYMKADGFGPMLSQPARFASSTDFWKFFFPSLTAMVGFWATLSLNIPDFTREAKSQRDQLWGQFLGLNTTMPLYAFIGVAVTSATVVIFGEAIWNPVELLARFDSVGLMIVSMFALTLATLTTNLAANTVAPATAFSNFLPRAISLRVGGIITGIIGILMRPWELIADPSGYIFTWLIGYSALLGPIGGILVCDYFVIRRRELNLAALYDSRGEYAYQGGYNLRALIALVLAIAPNVPGFLIKIGKLEASEFWTGIYHYAWFIGFLIAFVLYYLLMASYRPGKEVINDQMTK
ncbi:MAG TPA: NCS1 family nucleobase:cation symporter-1 [Kiritimatiellia bacterium]|nr:NCS1 family nucleobase:cation symporter-1 [Kiritimatiellia bacterium]